MVDRCFIFGSEWIYFKIYSGPKTLEQILIKNVLPLLNDLLAGKYIDCFFYIRYQDPDYHVRLRIHLNDTSNLGFVIDNFHKLLGKFVSDLIVSRVIVDTYKREIERYGNDFIIDIERLFYYDSLYILDFLKSQDGKDVQRWFVSAQYIDALLNRCELLLDKKIEFTSNCYLSFSLELYSNNPKIYKLLNSIYRDQRNNISLHLSENSQISNLPLTTYLDSIVFFTSRISDYTSSNSYRLLSSIIHMHINRMFRTKQRINEFAIYYLLNKYYISLKVRL